MNSDKVIEFENDLREIEKQLEKLGRVCCSTKGGQLSWGSIDEAIGSVRNAIHTAYLMDECQQ